MNNTKQETKRLYSCIMHDFHDGKDRQKMWERELKLVINSQVLAAITKIKSKSRHNYTVKLSDIEAIEKEYKP